MAVRDWVSTAPSVQTYEPFEGRLVTGGALIGAPVWADGVDGKCLSCSAQEGATIRPTAEVSRGYPMTVSCWFSFTAGAASAPVFQWGTTPSVSAVLHGQGSNLQPGTLEASVRMSNGRFALQVRSGALEPGRWHLVTIAVQNTTLWGGCRATAYVNGEQIGAGGYGGSLFDIVNFDRPNTVSVGVGTGGIMVDEFIAQEYELSAGQARALYLSAESLDAGTGSGWGVVF